MTHRVTKPIALDKSFNTTEQAPRNIADVLLDKMGGIAQALQNMSGNASLTIMINGEPHVYTPGGSNQVINIKGAILIDLSATFAEVSTYLTHSDNAVYLHLTGVGVDYMVPYVGGTNDTGFRFAIPDTQTASLKYWVLQSDNTWVTGSVPIAPASGVISGTYTKVTVNDKGVVTAGSLLLAADIPVLDASKITTGTFDPDRIGDASIEPVKLKYKKKLAVDGRTIQATEVGNTITLSTPEKLQPITRNAIYTVTTAAQDIDIIDGEYEHVKKAYSGSCTLTLTTSVTTDCHAIMFLENDTGYLCGTVTVTWVDEAMNQRSIDLDMDLAADSGYLLTIDIRKITHNNTDYAIARVSILGPHSDVY